MTLSRQLRHKARAERAAEPYRQARIAELVEHHAERGDEVIVSMTGRRGGVTGRVLEYEVGGYVRVGRDADTYSNVPWRMIREINAWL